MPRYIADGLNEDDSIKKRVVADGVDYSNVNQLVQNGNFENGNYWYDNGTNHTISNNVIKITATVTGTYRSVYYYPLTITANHKYYIGYEAKSNVSSLNCGIGANGEYWTDSFIANQNWQHFGKVTNLPNANGEAYLYIIAQNITDELHCRNVMLIDLTQIYGSGNEPTTVAQVKQDLCITDNTYIPYNLYGNGFPSIIPRKIANCGCVDLGLINDWEYNVGDYHLFSCYSITDAVRSQVSANIQGYTCVVGLGNVVSHNKSFCIGGDGTLWLRDDDFNDVSTFLQAKLGTKLYYELQQGV